MSYRTNQSIKHMHYSSQFKGSRKTNRPAWALSFVCLTIILYISISQGTALRTYYETWIKNLPKRQVLEIASQKELELDKLPGSVQTATTASPVLLPFYTDQTIDVLKENNPPLTAPTPESITQPVIKVEPAPQELALIPDRLAIPAIQVDTVVIPLSPERITIGNTSQLIWPVPPPDEAGWHSTSAPMGVPGNTVVNGHNYPQDAIFRSLYKLQLGDQVMLYAKDKAIEYVVVEILILPEQGQSLEIRQANARYIQPTDDERLTLVTCHPYGSLANRLVVIAMPAKNLVGITK